LHIFADGSVKTSVGADEAKNGQAVSAAVLLKLLDIRTDGSMHRKPRRARLKRIYRRRSSDGHVSSRRLSRVESA